MSFAHWQLVSESFGIEALFLWLQSLTATEDDRAGGKVGIVECGNIYDTQSMSHGSALAPAPNADPNPNPCLLYSLACHMPR